RGAILKVEKIPDIVDPQRQQSTRVVGALGDTLQRQSAATAATQGLLIVPQLIIALLGALVIGIVLTMLAIARDEELALLSARGASMRALAAGAAVEAACFAGIGAAAGLA